MKYSFNLSGQVSIVTGAAKGIGKAIAFALASNGATVLMNDYCSEDVLQSAADEINSVSGELCVPYRFDAGNPNEVKSFYNSVFKSYKRVDILVNNAGILRDNYLPMVSEADIASTYNSNVFSVMYNTQYASRLMARNDGGSIINLASIIGRFGNTGQTVYGGSKAAVIGITLSAAKELASQNIRVNAIAPGFIESDMTKNLSVEVFQERINSVKMGRIGTPEDVAKVALFLASDLSQYVTGQVIGVDGGMII